MIARNQSWISSVNPHAHNVRHLFHCLDYLRQNVLCSMDTTLEWPAGKKDHSLEHMNGYKILHTCKRRVSPTQVSVGCVELTGTHRTSSTI